MTYDTQIEHLKLGGTGRAGVSLATVSGRDYPFIHRGPVCFYFPPILTPTWHTNPTRFSRLLRC